VVAGGMESMTNAPHMVNARTGIRYGDGQLVDHMAWDGLTNPYDGKAMGVFGELCADKYHFTREEQDAYAIESVKRAQAAQQNGAFADEIVPVTVRAARATWCRYRRTAGPLRHRQDPDPAPAFRKENGTITAASSSSISDGAAAVVLLSADDANKRG
jgi:acetyl-CoA C-acetyltransferase